jgi:nanoRNase/pAp phosphatase (c-di-AMP/oligoRNAs hydrolase)
MMEITPYQYRDAKELIERSKKILILPHANVDPDGLSSALACYQFFTRLGKACTVLCQESLPETLAFLPGFEKLEQNLQPSREFIITLDCSRGIQVDKLQYVVEDQKVNIVILPKEGELRSADISLHSGALPYDLIIVVDTAELKLLGTIYERHWHLFSTIPVLNIDHHISNTQYGQVKLLNASAASTTEILYHWFSSDPEWKAHMTSDIATLLLTGLITDTRSFQNPNTTPHALEVAADLLDLGARQQEIIRFIYKTKPLSTLKIWGRALNHLQVNAKERIVWSSISKQDLAEMGGTSRETHGIIDDLLTTIPDADLYVLFTEMEEGGLKASMRSSELVDASSIAAKLFGGGGHARAAGFRITSFENFDLQVLQCIRSIIDEMQTQRGAKEPRKRQDIPPLTLPPGGAALLRGTGGVALPPSSRPPTIDVVHELTQGGKSDVPLPMPKGDD